jgi:hypothetical protein
MYVLHEELSDDPEGGTVAEVCNLEVIVGGLPGRVIHHRRIIPLYF